jgi:hypothetical protein
MSKFVKQLGKSWSAAFAEAPSRHQTFMAVLAAGAGMLLAASCQSSAFAWLLIAAIDLYLLLVIWMVADMGRDDGGKLGEHLPDRRAGLVILPLLYLGLVCAFACVYRVEGIAGGTELGVVYGSLMNMTTFTYPDALFDARPLRWVAAWQLVSGVLVLAAVLPLLVSRAASK